MLPDGYEGEESVLVSKDSKLDEPSEGRRSADLRDYLAVERSTSLFLTLVGMGMPIYLISGPRLCPFPF